MVDEQVGKNMMTAMDFVASLRMSQASTKPEHDEQLAALKMKHQLIERKELHFRCRQVSDIMCIIAMLGLVLMIIDTELRFYQSNTFLINLTRPLISISTMVLVGLLIYYHALDIRLYAINNHIADWRVTITIRALLFIMCEILLCAIHPFPRYSKSSVDGSDWFEMFLTLPSKCNSSIS